MQPVPEGYKPLGFAGFTDKGGYSESEVYAENDIVHNNNTTWRCLINGTTGITPAEGENWTVFIASESDSSGITTTDTQGIVGIAGQKVSNQDIIDELAERAANQKENQFGTINTFPVPGEPGIFYTDTETNLIYRWDAGSEGYVQVGGSESKAEDMISDAFSTSKAYAIGDYAIYENTLYKFTSAKTAGVWDATKVQAVTVAGELNSLSEDLASANTQIDELNGNLSKIQYSTKAVPNHTGAYGAYSNVICGHAKIGPVILLFFKGNVQGVTDITYSAFGLDYSLPPTLKNLLVASVYGSNGSSRLSFKADKEASMQIYATEEDMFCATFALLV